MRNFQRLASGINMTGLMLELARQPGLWNQHTLRTTHPGSPHTQVDDIWLRFQDLGPYQESIALAKARMEESPELGLAEAYQGLDVSKLLNDQESVNYPAMAALPAARDLIFNLMAGTKGERLGRCLVTRMRPGAKILPHVDGGVHAQYYDRYHFALQVLPGVVFRCGEEVAPMVTGESWWFDNGLEHEVVNNSMDDRLTLIVDIHHGGPGCP